MPGIRLAHVAHVGRDVRELNDWYREEFGVVGFMGWPEPHYLESERRYASMFMVGGLCVETMAPATPLDETSPIGRALARHGEHLFSMAFRVDDLAALGRRLLAEGVSIGAPGGGRAETIPDGARYFVPSRRDMAGLRIEVLDVVISGDPRSSPDWAPALDLAHITVEVPDPAEARDRLVGLLGAEPGGRPGFVRLGDATLELRSGAAPRLVGATLQGRGAPAGAAVVQGHGVAYVMT